jgi:hypothetical protein
VRRLLVTANVVPLSPVLVTLMMEELSSSETSVLTRATRRNITQYHLVFLRTVRRVLVTANVFPTSPILVTLIMEDLCSSETSVITRASRCNIPEDGILHEICWLYKEVTRNTFLTTDLPTDRSTNYKEQNSIFGVNSPLYHVRWVPLSPRHGASSGCRCKGRPSALEVSCEYIE